MGLKSSWIDFTTNDVPTSKYDTTCWSVKETWEKTKNKASNLLLSRQIESAIYCFFHFYFSFGQAGELLQFSFDIQT